LAQELSLEKCQTDHQRNKRLTLPGRTPSEVPKFSGGFLGATNLARPKSRILPYPRVVRKSLQVLHSQERRTIVLPDFINHADAGIIQRLRIAGQFFGQKLQRDRLPIWPTLSLVFPIKFQLKDAASIANKKAESVFPCRVFDTHAAASISSRPTIPPALLNSKCDHATDPRSI
jgi:hypothetical protein